MENKSILFVREIAKAYDSFTLKNISFEIKEASITGLIGPNGSGKSTTMKIILKIIEAASGSIYFENHNILDDSSNRFKASIGYVGEKLDYFEKMPLRNIKHFYQTYYPTWDEAYYKQLLRDFELKESYKMNQLSTGMRVKFAICLALSHKPRLLLLDEPTSGLDPLVRNEILSLLRDYANKHQAGILLSSHITEDMTKITDDLLFIYKGQIVDQKETKEVIESRLDIDAHLENLVSQFKKRSSIC